VHQHYIFPRYPLRKTYFPVKRIFAFFIN